MAGKAKLTCLKYILKLKIENKCVEQKCLNSFGNVSNGMNGISIVVFTSSFSHFMQNNLLLLVNGTSQHLHSNGMIYIYI